MMTRRTFLSALTMGTLFAPLAAGAQPAAKVWQIGYLASTPAATSHLAEAFRQGLRDLGWVEGQNVVIEFRWTQGDVKRLPDLVAELLRVQVDAIVAPTSADAEAARQATSTTPIVFVMHSDPIGVGHVVSLARPGRNMTGLALMDTEINAKGMELLREAVPNVTRVAVLWEPASPASTPALKAVDARARALGLKLQPLALRRADELDTLFSVMLPPDALLVLPGPVAFTERQRLAHLAVERRLPGLFPQREQAEAGGLMSYGANLADLFRRAAIYVDKILKGAKPADLPVEQPTKFELVINLKTAKALGLMIPQSLLNRADGVIQ